MSLLTQLVLVLPTTANLFLHISRFLSAVVFVVTANVAYSIFGGLVSKATCFTARCSATTITVTKKSNPLSDDLSDKQIATIPASKYQTCKSYLLLIFLYPLVYEKV